MTREVNTHQGYWPGLNSGLNCAPQPEQPPESAAAVAHVGLDYWILPRRTSRQGSSLSDHFSCLPARALSAELPDGADPAPGIQGCRAPGAPARERGLAPSDRPGPLRAGRPAVARGTVAIGSTPSVGWGVHGDPRHPALVDPVLGEVDRFGPLRIGLWTGELGGGTVRALLWGGDLGQLGRLRDPRRESHDQRPCKRRLSCCTRGNSSRGGLLSRHD